MLRISWHFCNWIVRLGQYKTSNAHIYSNSSLATCARCSIRARIVSLCDICCWALSLIAFSFLLALFSPVLLRGGRKEDCSHCTMIGQLERFLHVHCSQCIAVSNPLHSDGKSCYKYRVMSSHEHRFKAFRAMKPMQFFVSLTRHGSASWHRESQVTFICDSDVRCCLFYRLYVPSLTFYGVCRKHACIFLCL